MSVLFCAKSSHGMVAIQGPDHHQSKFSQRPGFPSAWPACSSLARMGKAAARTQPVLGAPPSVLGSCCTWSPACLFPVMGASHSARSRQAADKAGGSRGASQASLGGTRLTPSRFLTTVSRSRLLCLALPACGARSSSGGGGWGQAGALSDT